MLSVLVAFSFRPITPNSMPQKYSPSFSLKHLSGEKIIPRIIGTWFAILLVSQIPVLFIQGYLESKRRVARNIKAESEQSCTLLEVRLRIQLRGALNSSSKVFAGLWFLLLEFRWHHSLKGVAVVGVASVIGALLSCQGALWLHSMRLKIKRVSCLKTLLPI